MQKAKSLLVFTLFFISFTTLKAQSKYPSILWEIKKTKTSKPSYLFGTYHISSKGVFNLGDSIFYALKNVDIVAKEVNVSTWQYEQNFIDEMQYDYSKYTNGIRKSSFNKSTVCRTNTIEKLPFFISAQPRFVNYFLFRSSDSNDGFEEEMFLDKFISSAGYKYGKEVKGLENYMESNILYLQAQKDQADLEKTDRKQLPDGITYKEMGDKIYDGYLNHNLDAMDSFMIYQFESEAFYNKFLKERNYNQADSMDFYIKTGKTLFAAVGAAHLPGKDGVIEIMRKKGYSVRPVKLKFSNTDELEAVKKKIIPLQNTLQNIDEVLQVKAPGTFYTYEKTDIVKSYGYVDMANSAFYYVSRLYNNASYFNYDSKKISTAIDSLLFSNIKGDIVEKSFSMLDGYNCVNVTTKVKNKDIERYKFVITPYEIIKFQVGGKNEFAKASFVDEFFNSIKIVEPKKLTEEYSFKFKNDYPLHVWNINNVEYLQSKQKFSYYDAATKQLNSCIKLAMPEGEITKDSLMSHLIRESFLSSESFSKTFLYDENKMPIANNKINKLSLINGQTMLIKYQINYPFVYLLSSLKSENPSPDFINSFELKDNKLAAQQLFIDSSKGFKLMLPYSINIDKKWKYEMERKKKTYEDVKSPNDYANIFYKPTMYGYDSERQTFSFEDAINMETVDLAINKFDKDNYFTTATEFWKKIIDPYTEKLKDYKDYGGDYNDDIAAPAFNDYLAKNQNKKLPKITNLLSIEEGTKVDGLVYDTLNNKLQSVSFYELDTLLNSKIYHQYKLTDNNLFHLSFKQFNKEKTAFQKLITESFTPLQNENAIPIFKSNFTEIIEEYQKANLQKRPNVLKRLNNLFLGVGDLGAIDAVFKKQTKNIPEDNILRRKLMAMVADGLYDKKDWATISNWLKNIFSNKAELVTLREFALSSIITKYDSSDAGWLIENLYKKNSLFQKNAAYQMMGYLKHITPKTLTIPYIPLVFNDKDDFYNLNLIDSGYYTTAEKLKAFEAYKKMLEADSLDIKLSQEKINFEFKESEINETLTNDNNYDNQFNQLIKGFNYFYTVAPTDALFDESLKKLLDAKADKDLLTLLSIFLKQEKPDYNKVDKIVAQVGKENNNLIELNTVFSKNERYDKLPSKFKEKKLLAKYYLLASRGSYNKLDSLTFIGIEKYPYNNTDSVYFFKYISDKEKNANIAYVVFDNKNNFLTTLPISDFTTEQINKNETYEKVVKKLMRQSYTNTYFSKYNDKYSRNNFYQFTNQNKSLESEE